MSEDARIVVGVDGSEAARVALRWALAEAELRGATLDVLHAWHAPVVFIPREYRDELVEMGRMDLAALDLVERELDAVGADAATAVRVERREAHAGAAHALVDSSKGAALVVVGRRGTGGLVHELVAPKVIQVAHHAACPVAVVPEAWTGDGRGVVVGVDGSDQARDAVRWAADEAAHRATELTAVLAWGLLDQKHAAGDDKFDPDYGSDDATAVLRDALADALGPDVPATVTASAVNDLPASALLDASRGAELLVVGARGLGGFRELLLGSVSHRCLVHATCPTVVVR